MTYTLVVTDVKAGTAYAKEYTLKELLSLIEAGDKMGDNLTITFTDPKGHPQPHIYYVSGKQDDE